MMMRLLVLMLLGVILSGTPELLLAQDDTPVEQTEEKSKNKKKDKKKKDKKKKNKQKGGDEDTGDVSPSASTPSGNDMHPASHIFDSTRTVMGELCPRYRRGKMEFIDKNFYGVNIKRKRRRETWVNAVTGNKLKFKIDWPADNYYTLVFKKSKDESRYRKGDTIHCLIRKCHPDPENYYDVDMDLHAIVNYASVLKGQTSAELKTQMAEQEALLKAQEEAEREKIEDEQSESGEGRKSGSESRESGNESNGESKEKSGSESRESGEDDLDKDAAKAAKEKAKAAKKAAKEKAKADKKAAKEKAKAEKEAAKAAAEEEDGDEE